MNRDKQLHAAYNRMQSLNLTTIVASIFETCREGHVTRKGCELDEC